MEERFTAGKFIDYVLKSSNTKREDYEVAPTVVITWWNWVVEEFARLTGAHAPKHSLFARHFSVRTGEIGGEKVTFVLSPIGAPATVSTMEELIALGAERFIGFGLTGSLQEKAGIGTVVIPDESLSEEGTSSHYIKRKDGIRAGVKLLKALSEACAKNGKEFFTGKQWTTDAIYRELVSKIDRYRIDGVVGVDMETSAMYALGEFRKIDVCNLLVVSDELWHEWNPAFGQEILKNAMKDAIGVVIEALKNQRIRI